MSASSREFGAGERQEILLLGLEADPARHLLLLDAHAALLHRALRLHLRLAHLPLLVLDRNLGRELVLLDGAVLLDSGVAARIGRLVGAPQQGFARLGLERA